MSVRAENPQRRRIVFQDSESDESEDDQNPRNRPPRPSTLRQSLAPTQRRRRSSASRFMRLSTHTNLNEVYQRAIRMNAENRINAGNSWNLQLIDNMDKFLSDDTAETKKDNRINFTKASCTLDASVKIYSYRVDDVYLTSYKVLANLSRNENKQTGKQQQNETQRDDDDDNDEEQAAPKQTKKAGNTLEGNLANINTNKLDSAFDIDPLFHKMSKAFDEGGAKGLLLVNLGLGDHCNIVFESSLETGSSESTTERPERPVDTLSLSSKLSTLLNGQSLDDLTLVPQLANLREQFSELQEEGWVDDVPTTGLVQRYAAQAKEEHAADRSIHKEALQRSVRKTPGGRTINLDSPESGGYAAPDFGGGDDDDDYDAFGDDDFGNGPLDNILGVADSDGARFSLESPEHEDSTWETPENQATTVLLDAIASNSSFFEGSSDAEFINSQTLSQVMDRNQWAGAMHWKASHRKKQAIKTPSKAGKTPRKKASKDRCLATLDPPNLKDVLKKPPKKSQLQLSKAVVTKHRRNDNLLPFDAGIGVEELTKLFLLPDKQVAVATHNTKTVDFDEAVETWDDGGNENFDDDHDNDGPGFDFADDNVDEEETSVVAELDDVRIVDKVQVGYATVAKKVDVKRLKRDLWIELESRFEISEDATEAETAEDEEPQVVSFQNAVGELEATKSQLDVSLSFYFICVLHLANEKGLRLDSKGLDDFEIVNEGAAGQTY
jgi:condensin complex subunit 2